VIFQCLNAFDHAASDAPTANFEVGYLFLRAGESMLPSPFYCLVAQ